MFMKTAIYTIDEAPPRLSIEILDLPGMVFIVYAVLALEGDVGEVRDWTVVFSG